MVVAFAIQEFLAGVAKTTLSLDPEQAFAALLTVRVVPVEDGTGPTVSSPDHGAPDRFASTATCGKAIPVQLDIEIPLFDVVHEAIIQRVAGRNPAPAVGGSPNSS
jgi:hypothetical protein